MCLGISGRIVEISRESPTVAIGGRQDKPYNNCQGKPYMNLTCIRGADIIEADLQ